MPPAAPILEDMLKDKLYSKIGELTVQFATLEHRLQSLLKLLVGKDNEIIGPFFIHELNLFVLMRKIRLIAGYRLKDRPWLLEDLERDAQTHRDHARPEKSSRPRRLADQRGLHLLPRQGPGLQDQVRRRPVAGNGRDDLQREEATHLTRRLHADALEIDHLIHRIRNNE